MISPHHHARRMGGREPNERDRVATPLELLFDLTFATCFGLAAAHYAAVLRNADAARRCSGLGSRAAPSAGPGSVSRGSLGL